MSAAAAAPTRTRILHSTYAQIRIHTAKCDTCNGRNLTGDLWRCTDCGWSVCRACRAARGMQQQVGGGGGGETETERRDAGVESESDERGPVDRWHFWNGRVDDDDDDDAM
ncbi:MAG: hypothetical protein M1816_004487 [Peltula sp. TS41687]|nr:MAG: hypothetical protein M1816_004487 [Peltula sp. TS41687]